MYLDSYLCSGLFFLASMYGFARILAPRIAATSVGKAYPSLITFTFLAKKYIPLAILGLSVFIGLAENNFASNNLNATICAFLGMSLSYEVFHRSFTSISVGSLTYLLILRSMDFM